MKSIAALFISVKDNNTFPRLSLTNGFISFFILRVTTVDDSLRPLITNEASAVFVFEDLSRSSIFSPDESFFIFFILSIFALIFLFRLNVFLLYLKKATIPKRIIAVAIIDQTAGYSENTKNLPYSLISTTFPVKRRFISTALSPSPTLTSCSPVGADNVNFLSSPGFIFNVKFLFSSPIAISTGPI